MYTLVIKHEASELDVEGTDEVRFMTAEACKNFVKGELEVAARLKPPAVITAKILNYRGEVVFTMNEKGEWSGKN